MKTLWKTLTVSGLLLALAACGGGGGGPVTISVNGKVLDSSGNPVSGANILLNGSNLKTTGADGTFSYASVIIPYSLTVQTGTDIQEYQGLTRANPQIGGNGSHTALVAGVVTGPTFPLPAGQGILVSGTGAFGFIAANSTTGSYSGNIAWVGSSSKTTDLVALHLKVAGSAITDYLQLGRRTGVTLNVGVGQTGLNIPLNTAVPSTTTTFTLTTGAYSNSASSGLIYIKAGGAMFIVPGLLVSSGTTVKIPSEGAGFLASGKDADGNTVAAIVPANTTGSSNITLPAATVLKNSLPAAGATGVDKRPTLSWTPVSGVGLYKVTLSGAGKTYTLYVPASAGASLQLPDYSVLGASLAGSTVYGWEIQAFQGMASSSDDLTNPDGSNLELSALLSNTPIFVFSSKNTSFTTVP